MVISTGSTIEEFLQEMGRLVEKTPRGPIEEAAELLYTAWRNGRTVFTLGNGGSASTATHLACDLAKFSVVPGSGRRLKAMSLVDNIPLVSAWTNDAGFSSIFAEQLEPWLEQGDVLIAISVHGGSGGTEAGLWSQNLLRAVSLAKERGATTIGLSGFDGGALREMADVCIVAEADSEPLGTALVESFHVLVHHLLCLALKMRVLEGGDA